MTETSRPQEHLGPSAFEAHVIAALLAQDPNPNKPTFNKLYTKGKDRMGTVDFSVVFHALHACSIDTTVTQGAVYEGTREFFTDAGVPKKNSESLALLIAALHKGSWFRQPTPYNPERSSALENAAALQDSLQPFGLEAAKIQIETKSSYIDDRDYAAAMSNLNAALRSAAQGTDRLPAFLAAQTLTRNAAYKAARMKREDIPQNQNVQEQIIDAVSSAAAGFAGWFVTADLFNQSVGRPFLHRYILANQGIKVHGIQASVNEQTHTRERTFVLRAIQ